MDKKISAGACMVMLFDRTEPDADAPLWIGLVGSRIQAGQLAGWVRSASGGDFELTMVCFEHDVFFVDQIAATQDLRKAMAL